MEVFSLSKTFLYTSDYLCSWMNCTFVNAPLMQVPWSNAKNLPSALYSHFSLIYEAIYSTWVLQRRKNCWLWWSSLVIILLFSFFFFLDVKWKGRPRMEVQKFLSSCTEKARVTKGSSEKAGEYAMAHQTWTDESTWDPHPWPLMCTWSLTIWASHVQFLLVTGVSGR